MLMQNNFKLLKKTHSITFQNRSPVCCDKQWNIQKYFRFANPMDFLHVIIRHLEIE